MRVAGPARSGWTGCSCWTRRASGARGRRWTGPGSTGWLPRPGEYNAGETTTCHWQVASGKLCAVDVDRDLRAALLRATAEVVAAEGVDAISIRALARTAGVSHAAHRHHFASRTGLLTA